MRGPRPGGHGGHHGMPRGFHGGHRGHHMPPPPPRYPGFYRRRYGGGCLGCLMYVIGAVALLTFAVIMIF